MALTSTPRPLAIGTRKGIAGGSPLDPCIEGTTQTYLAFAPVILSSGKAIESTSPLSSTNKTIGLANSKATGTVNTEALVLDVAPDVIEVEATLSDATAGTHTLAQTDVGLIYPITKDTTGPTAFRGNWYADANAAATDGLLVQRLKDPVGTVDGRVYGKITRPALLGG